METGCGVGLGQDEGDRGTEIVELEIEKIQPRGLIVRDNVFGTPEEDAFRRDFTVNALFYNIEDFSVIDYVGGMEDLKARVIRSIGDPERRYVEDPVRMIRAIRFAAALEFDIEPATYAAIVSKKEHLANAAPARMYEEIQKLFFCGKAAKVLDRAASNQSA